MSRGPVLHTYLVVPDDGEATEVRGRLQPLDALGAVLPPHCEGARFVGRMREDDGEWSRFTCVATAAAWEFRGAVLCEAPASAVPTRIVERAR